MAQANPTQNRKYGLDLLRSLSMLFVIVLHILNHGDLLAAYENDPAGKAVCTLIQAAVYPAVDCFVLISGYLLSGLPFRLSRVVRTWIPVAFWSVVIQCIFFALEPESVSPGNVLFMFLPVLSGRYWFVNGYLVMLLVSPFLNRLLRELPRWQMRGLLLVSLVVFCLAPIPALGNDVFGTQNGFGFPWFLALYLWGGYIRRCCPRIENKKGGWLVLLYGALCVFQVVWILSTDLLGSRFPELAQMRSIFLKYTAVPVFGSALCLLLYFSSERFSKETALRRLCSRISPMVFSVYLIHDHPLVRGHLIAGRFAALNRLPLPAAMICAAGAACGIFLVCVALDHLRDRLFRWLRVDVYGNKVGDTLAAKIITKLKGEP